MAIWIFTAFAAFVAIGALCMELDNKREKNDPGKDLGQMFGEDDTADADFDDTSAGYCVGCGCLLVMIVAAVICGWILSGLA